MHMDSCVRDTAKGKWKFNLFITLAIGHFHVILMQELLGLFTTIALHLQIEMIVNNL